MQNELKPCKICGSKHLYVFFRKRTNTYRVHCCNNDCLAMGPMELTEQEAIEAWNRRAGEE